MQEISEKSIARKMYESHYLKPFFDGQTARLIKQYHADSDTLSVQKEGLFQSYASISAYVVVLPAFLVHAAKLVKNLVLLVATALLCFFVLFNDRKMAKTLAQAMVVDLYLIGVNALNTMLAMVSPVVGLLAPFLRPLLRSLINLGSFLVIPLRNETKPPVGNEVTSLTEKEAAKAEKEDAKKDLDAKRIRSVYDGILPAQWLFSHKPIKDDSTLDAISEEICGNRTRSLGMGSNEE